MLYKILIKIFLSIDNFLYKLISVLSIKEEGGIHPKHRLMNYHKFFVDNINSEDAVLDVGCGNGALSFDIAKKAKKVTGIDLNKENIKFAKENFYKENIEYIHGDAIKNLPTGRFDAVILSNILEHIKNRIDFLNKIKELAPKILIRVPMINRDWTTLYKKELGLGWKLDKTHFIEYTLESFQEELGKSDLKIQNYSVQFGEIWGVVTAI